MNEGIIIIVDVVVIIIWTTNGMPFISFSCSTITINQKVNSGCEKKSYKLK